MLKLVGVYRDYYFVCMACSSILVGPYLLWTLAIESLSLVPVQ